MQECKEGECVIRQKDRGDKFYIVESVSFQCSKLTREHLM